ncbi:MAG: hypothetical protein IJ776_11320 [Paludibacteraceae bacterium]|nr:hypothetical protein [Paludibacteraceae bacterium]
MKRSLLAILIVLSATGVAAREYADSAVYQGINLKIDLATPVLEIARSKATVMSYEAALNVRLVNRFYPTLEWGYGQGDCTAAGGNFHGMGGFGRIGLDLAALKKSRKDNMLLVGIRLGTAVQGYELTDVRVWDTYWQKYTTRGYDHMVRADVWGEVVAGVQVKVYKSFHMGWYVRLKLLFTRKENGTVNAWYIPGFGYRQDTNFGINYYLGWKF